MKRILQKYAAFIRQPDVARLLCAALLARMPVGMVGFGMVMFLRESMGSFALAGIAVGINFVALAAAAPIQGRLADRHGPRRLLMVTSVVQPLSLLAIVASVKLQLPFAVIAFFAVLAGCFASPITTLIRTTWRHRFESDDDRRTAFALDAVTIELNFTLGPALIALILAYLGTTVAFCVAIAAVVFGSMAFFASPALRYFRSETGVKRHLLGPLTEPRLWLVFLTTFGLTVAFGLLEIGYPAYGTALAAPALGGILLAINSLGSAIGGAIYGGVRFRAPVERQFACILALMAVPLFLHAVAGTTALFGFAAFLAGALIAPSITAQSLLVSRLAPSHYATEAFTWSTTFIVSGIGAGMALGGFIVEHSGVREAFVVGGFIVAAMALLALGIAPHPAGATLQPAQDKAD